MKAHLFMEGGGMVTGTDDVTAARRIIVEKYLDEASLDRDDRQEIAYASRIFAKRSASVETGRIVPTGPTQPDGYAWFWRSGYEPGRPGVTRAVVWSS